MQDSVKSIDQAMKHLLEVYQEGNPTEIADLMDMLSAYREQYIEDNSQFGTGA